MNRELRVFPTPESLAHAAADLFVTVAAEAIAARGYASLMLSGGSTPRAVHAHLASAEVAERIDWPRVHLFWGDERCVSPDHPDSNYRMARETLLDHVRVPQTNVHRIRGEVDPALAEDEYERELRVFFAERGSPAARFDLIFLGLGEDGHTASLFPGTPGVREATRWVVSVEHAAPPPLVARISVTPALLNRAAQVAFLVVGAAKAARLREVLTAPYQPDRLPAQAVRPDAGSLLWFVDEAAAAHLPPAAREGI